MCAAAAYGCISAEIENFLFFCTAHCTLLPQPHASNTACVNQTLCHDSTNITEVTVMLATLLSFFQSVLPWFDDFYVWYTSHHITLGIV